MTASGGYFLKNSCEQLPVRFRNPCPTVVAHPWMTAQLVITGWPSHVGGDVEKRTSLQNEFDIVFGLVTTSAMNSDDFNKPIEDRGTLPFLRSDKVNSHKFTIAWVTSFQPLLQLSQRFRMAQVCPRDSGMGPPKDKSPFRCTKASAQDVIEGIKISSPVYTRYEYLAHLIVKSLK